LEARDRSRHAGPIARLALACIRRYQAAGGGARVFGVDCNFTPTCSDYAAGAIERYGLWRGARLAWQRIRRCNRRDLLEHIDDPLPERWP
jgi:putative membrane protein insertion efficiency factor